MNNQDLKIKLLKEFGDKTLEFIRDAYKFITEDDAPDQSDHVDFSPYPKAVDLGLLSGTLWCDRNVGAESPFDDGAYFSWGNITPHRARQSDENEWGDTDEAFFEDFTSDIYEKTAGAMLEGNIDLEHDAARHNMGETWQMPTAEQFQELFDNCDWIRKVINGVAGYLVVSRINGNSIFFSCSGNGSGTSRNDRGSYGSYWSSTVIDSRSARSLDFYSGGVYPQNYYYRYNGFAVRAVQNFSQK